MPDPNWEAARLSTELAAKGYKLTRYPGDSHGSEQYVAAKTNLWGSTFYSSGQTPALVLAALPDLEYREARGLVRHQQQRQSVAGRAKKLLTDDEGED